MAEVIDVSAVQACLAAYSSAQRPERATERSAVRTLMAELERRAPGHSVEVRVPPYAAVQVVEGVRHRRGTPPATVECDAQTFIEVASGVDSWADKVAAGRLIASGERSDLAYLMPIVSIPTV